MADLRALARIGAVGTGVSRPAMTAVDLEARQWLRERMEQAGLDASIDGLGNVMGRAPRARRTVLVGSHTDTVPNGGWLDGALGAIFGLEIARAWRESHPEAAVGVDAISFADEEGAFAACLGSRAFLGVLEEREWALARDGAGHALTARLEALGLAGRPRFRLEPDRQLAFFEAHIEQGPVLIDAGISVGIVEGIVGVRRHRVRFAGQSDHAGTTPMERRRDASTALFAFAALAADRLRGAGSARSVWNMGVVNVRPGAANVVANEAEVVVEFRDARSDVMDRMEEALERLVRESDGAGGVGVSSERIANIAPTTMNERLIGRLIAAAEAEGVSYARMPSGAGHDAMILGRAIPAAMLFAPSIGGRSHDVTEDTREADIRRALRVFAAAVEATLEALEGEGAGAE